MKNKITIAALVAIIMALSPLALADATYGAAVQECTDGDFVFEIVEGNAIITEFLDEDAEAVTVPATLGNEGTDYPVKELGNGSFKETELTDITLLEGLTSIGKNAFKDCEELVSISFPSTIVKIGENAFYPSTLCDEEGNPLDTSADIAEIAGSVFDRAPGQNKFCIRETADVVFTVTFDSDGGSDVASRTYAAGSVLTAPASPTKEGYTFAGWEPALPGTMPAENITVKAVWTEVLPEEVTVTFDTDGESEIEALSGTPGSVLTAPASPTKEGYTFAGWEPALPETMPSENMTAKAVWTANTYSISFDTVGGSPVNEVQLAFGSDVEASAVPLKTGYTFAGWEPALPETMPAKNISVKAVWTVNSYTITFDSDGGSAVPAFTAEFGSDVPDPSIPQKDGFTFAGWEPALPETVPAKDMVLKALWKAIPAKHTVSFDCDGGSDIGALTFDEGSAIESPEDPVKDGYTFKGWEPALPETMPSEDLEVKAIWEKTESFMDKELNINIPSLNELREMAYEGVDVLTEKIGMEDLEEGQKDILFIALGVLMGALVIGLIVRRHY